MWRDSSALQARGSWVAQGAMQGCAYERRAAFRRGLQLQGLDIGTALDKHCPDGIDVYFDNVGGETLDAVLARLNEHARLPICGQISEYDVMNSADQYGTEFPEPVTQRDRHWVQRAR